MKLILFRSVIIFLPHLYHIVSQSFFFLLQLQIHGKEKDISKHHVHNVAGMMTLTVKKMFADTKLWL